MHRSLTVWEVLYYNAVLRLPPPSDWNVYEITVKQVDLINFVLYFVMLYELYCISFFLFFLRHKPSFSYLIDNVIIGHQKRGPSNHWRRGWNFSS